MSDNSIKVLQDTKILIQSILSQVVRGNENFSISIPIIMVNTIISDGDKIETQTEVISQITDLKEQLLRLQHGYEEKRDKALIQLPETISDVPVMNAKEAAKRLHLSRHSLYKYMRNGTIGYTKIGKDYRILRSEIDRFLTRTERG